MTLRQSNNPYGYRDLLVYKKAEELQKACAALSSHFPRSKTLVALADQMDRSARSVKQNIVEGWKRNSTKEYYDFLGFAIGANAELEEDCNDIINKVYKDLAGSAGEINLPKVEGMKFYPLDTALPPVVQMKLRCKELNLLFKKLQDSLAEKMHSEHTMSASDKFNRAIKDRSGQDAWFADTLTSQGLVRMQDGSIVPKEDTKGKMG